MEIYAGCTNVARVEIAVSGTLFDFSQFARIRFFVRNRADFSVQIIDSIDDPGTITVVSQGVLDLAFGDVLLPGNYYAGLKVFVAAGDTEGQMLFHDEEQLLSLLVFRGVPNTP